MFGIRFRDTLPPDVVEEFEMLIAGLRRFLLAEHNEDGTHRAASQQLGVSPIGTIVAYGGATAPSGWLLCDGTQVSRITYASLFEVLSTTYGVGDGVLTFNLPNLRQRFPLGKAAAGTGATLGSTGGAIDHTHSMGSHSHSVSITTSAGGDHSHGGNTGNAGSHSHSQGAHSHAVGSGSPNLADGAGDDAIAVYPSTQTDIFNDAGTSTEGDHNHSISASGTHTHSVSGTTGSSSGTSGSNNPPYQVVNYIIYTGVAG